jgi:hypothetical protein
MDSEYSVWKGAGEGCTFIQVFEKIQKTKTRREKIIDKQSNSVGKLVC